jgi:predicted regulator of Ras-like GTPase activity (Roadblock/LC7/MglB family)
VGFEARLEQLLGEVEGAVASALVGADGLPLGQRVAAGGAGVEFDAALVEWGAVLAQARAAAAALGAGGLEELSLQVGGLWVLMRPVSGEYHLLLAVRPGGNPGKGRFLLRLFAPGLAAELGLST